MPSTRRLTVPNLLFLLAGLSVGWLVGGVRTPPLRAQGNDRWDESVLATGPTFIRYNEGTKVQVAQDAIYYLDYRSGTLVGTVPTLRQTVGGSKMIDTFAERDLAADFKLDLGNGASPHFLMTTGSMWQGASSIYGDGSAPLFVFESTSRQVAVYRIQQQQVGTSNQMRLELLELRPFGRPPVASR